MQAHLMYMRVDITSSCHTKLHFTDHLRGINITSSTKTYKVLECSPCSQINKEFNITHISCFIITGIHYYRKLCTVD